MCSLAETDFYPGTVRDINKLCNMFHRKRPPKPPIPMWDIGLVLRALSSAPFEPLDTVSLEAITCKTFVLIVLALGARRGELCALRRSQFICLAEDWSFLLLYSYPPFISKTAKGRLATEPYKLRALLPGAPPSDDAMVLCPVTALKAYMEKTADPTERLCSYR